MPYLLLTLTTVGAPKARKGGSHRSPLAYRCVTKVTTSHMTLPRFLELLGESCGEGVG
jgi:hypothetical protein